MAKIIDSTIESSSVNQSCPIWKISAVGVILGILYWCLTILILLFVSSLDVAGNIATIIIAVIGLIIIMNLFAARPLLIAVASAILLWGLAVMTNGLAWFEIIAWNVLLYGMSYTVFAWLSRYKKAVPVLIVVTMIVICLRVMIYL